MEQDSSPDDKLSPQSKRSFNRFLAIVIVVMVVTGFLALWDNWGGDVIEQTGPGETKKLVLPNQIEVILLPESLLSFQKGSAHKILLMGSADVTIDHGPITREISFETEDAIAKSKESSYHLETNENGTQIEVNAGQVHFILKPVSAGAIFMEQGESYQHKRED